MPSIEEETDPSTLDEARRMLTAARDELRSCRLLAKILYEEGNVLRGLFAAARRQRATLDARHGRRQNDSSDEGIDKSAQSLKHFCTP